MRLRRVDKPFYYSNIIEYFDVAYYTEYSIGLGSQFVCSEMDLGANFSPQTFYEPPLMNVEAVHIGLSKHIRVNNAITWYDYTRVLSWLKLSLSPYLVCDDWGIDESIAAMDPDKASGVYWKQNCGPKKSDVLSDNRYRDGVELVRFFREETGCFSLILKDELRKRGKVARLFHPAPIEMILVGNMCFGAQNAKLTQHVLEHPITIGLHIPGYHTFQLFTSLMNFGGDCHDGDANQWDASVPAWLSCVCRDLRCSCYSPSQKDRLYEDARRYYAMTYYGWCNCTGNVMCVPSQKSGQVTTGHGNSMKNYAILILHAIRAGMTYLDFVQNVKCYCNGDDLIYSTKTRMFEPHLVYGTYKWCGIYVESDCVAKNIYDITYLGVSPVERYVESYRRTFLLVKYNRDKILNTLMWFKKGRSDTDHLSKLVSLVILSFGDRELYEALRQFTFEWLVKKISEGVRFHNKTYASLLLFLTDEKYILQVYLNRESFSKLDCTIQLELLC